MTKTKLNILTDEELIKNIIDKKDSNFFAVLYDRYAEIVYNKCYGFAKSKEEAEDLTHDVFIRLFVKLRSFKGNSKFSTWLYSFVYNHCVNYVQRDTAKKFEKITVVSDIIKDIDIDEIQDTDLFQLKSEKLVKALEIIDPSDKMILLMKYQDDMSLKEIQGNLDIGFSAVKMRLKRAKSRVLNAYNNL